MRYINIEDKTPPIDWCKKAEDLTSELKNQSDIEERKKIITKKKLWNDPLIKNWLIDLFHNKCWYSEAKEKYSFYDVDHFRPKKRAKQLNGDEREGYWWLAYDWKNYRICGNIGNRPHKDETGQTRGKGDYFPLREDSPIAISPSYDIHHEIIYLLDPTDPQDPLLLTFDESGMPIPTFSIESWEYMRAKETIRILHLDYHLLVEERKKIWVTCSLLIAEIETIIKTKNKIISESDKSDLKNKIEKLRELISEKAEFSSTARACLLSSGRQWVMSLA